MPKLIIASEYILASQNSTGYMWSKIVQALCKEDFDLEVIVPAVPVKYESFEGSASLVNKLFKQFVIAFFLAKRILKVSDRRTTLLTGTNPVLLLCIIPFLIFLRRFQWILLVHDVFPENLVAGGFLNENSIFYKILACYFDRVYSLADVLICIGRDMQLVIETKTGNKGKSVYLPNWVDERDVYPLPRNLGFLGFEDCLVFQFFGNVGRLQGVNTLLTAISMVKSENAAFIFIGGGALVPDVKQFINENPSKKIVYLGHLPLSKKNAGLSMCDVALVSLETKMLGLGVPSKAYFSLAAGKPILAAVESESEIGQMLKEHQVGWRCDPGSPDQIANMIDKLCSSPCYLAHQSPRDVFLNNYTEQVVLRKLINILKLKVGLVFLPNKAPASLQ
jgi:glycosyltransferase involved in cell wall biosynthesis